MELITKAQTEQLLANGRAQRAAIDQDAGALDFNPVVKLFTPTPKLPGCSPSSIPTGFSSASAISA